ncbi:MAG: PASTA domain-containing protein [Melioribacteraceae bacterium]|jgi:serine/threonine-protein kinase|nr:PASTA domain-containing protein [Melioribacteraceae bacterium]RJP56400.1 MAG: PASTA domain-containing protein [Ignavibacteriales bacterium]WKZ68022.1 MAG: PASTA domain-containing protein [Melioribacteraceae bacterium]
MDFLNKKIIKYPIILIAAGIILLILFDKVFMPWYVSADEVIVPDFVGQPKVNAIEALKQLNLQPIEEGPKYDEQFPKDHVIFHIPEPGSKVKVGRRVYLYISGGEPLIKMPQLLGKTIRDAKITIERLGLEVDTVINVRSEFPARTVVEQNINEGEFVAKGKTITLKISIGPQLGMVRVPNLIAKSLTEAERMLRELSLRIGKKTYLASPNLLPNTIIDQYPSEDKLVNYGDSVDVVITQSR